MRKPRWSTDSLRKERLESSGIVQEGNGQVMTKVA